MKEAMKLKQAGLITLLGSMLASCALLGPKYSAPDLAAPATWSSTDAKSVIESSILAELAWWRKFNDSQLNQLIESGLAHNNNIQMAMGNLLQAQAALQKVQMNWVPNLNLGGVGFVGQSFNPAFQNNSSNPAFNNFSSQNPQNFNGYGVGLMPSYTLNVFSQIKQGEIAKLNLAMQAQAVNAIKLAVIGQIAGSYFSLLGTQRQLDLQQQLINDAEEMRKYNLLKYQSGSSSDLSVSVMDQYIAGLKAKIPALKSDLTQIQNALRVLVDQNPGNIVSQNNFAKLSPDGIIPLNLPSSVLKNRPDVIMAEYQLQVANANIGAVSSQFFPTISLTGMLGQGSLALSNLFNAGADFWLAQAGAALPLLNLSLYAEIDQAKGGYYAAYYGYIQTVRTAFLQVDNGLAAHDNLAQTAHQQLLALAKAQELYQFSQHQYQQGAIAYSDSLGFKLNIDYAEASLNQIKVEQMKSIVNLYQVLAGGYNVESELSVAKKFGDSHDIK